MKRYQLHSVGLIYANVGIVSQNSIICFGYLDLQCIFKISTCLLIEGNASKLILHRVKKIILKKKIKYYLGHSKITAIID